MTVEDDDLMRRSANIVKIRTQWADLLTAYPADGFGVDASTLADDLGMSEAELREAVYAAAKEFGIRAVDVR